MMSSIESLCRVPALIEILNHPHLKKEIFCLPINRDNFMERDVALQRAVAEFLKDFHYVLRLSTPKHLILLIGFEMWKWAEYLKKHFDLSFEFSQNFIRSSFFTSNGLIDEEKAAMTLLMEPTLSNFLKYNIACQYFLEDFIPGLWEVLQKNKINFRKMLEEHKSRIPMILWYNYLLKKNSASTLMQMVKTCTFKIRVFSYGLKHKNIAAVKFSLGSNEGSMENKTEEKIVREFVYKSFCDYVSPILEYQSTVSIDSLLRKNFLANINIILHFISLMNKEELKAFFLNLDNSFRIFKWLLLWPHQNRFMDMVQIFFEKFGLREYFEVIEQIILLHDDQYMCQSFNYRLLLREFWIKSPPQFKQEFIKSEGGRSIYPKFIERLFLIKNFTSEDFANIKLILESADIVDRELILFRQGIKIFQCIIFTHGNFKLADLFLKILWLQQETLRDFKKHFTFYSLTQIIMKKDINLFNKIFKWVVGSDEIDDFKEQVFNWLSSDPRKTCYLFFNLEEERPFYFLNKILKWFLKTDEKVEEWKKNIVYSPLLYYREIEWLDHLLRYQGHSHEEALVTKREILLRDLPKIASCFWNYAKVRESHIDLNIFCLCSYEKEKLREFTDHLRSFYVDCIKEKTCLLCLNLNLVHGDGEETELSCEDHGIREFISLGQVDRICSSLLKQFDSSLNSQEWNS